MGAFRDLTGLRFGSLVVVEAAGKTAYGNYMWKCRCDCGRTVTVASGNLTSGHTVRCGRSCGMELVPGQRFGSLVVVGRTGELTENKSELWECRCDCGNAAKAIAYDLMNGKVTSCGCNSHRTAAINESTGVVDGTRLSNLGNKPPANNTTGVRGVIVDKRSGGYIAQIKFQGRNRRLGHFRTLAEAAEARRQAEEELFDPVLEKHGREKTSEGAYQEALASAIERHDISGR